MDTGTAGSRALLALLGLVASYAATAESGDFPIVGISTGVNVTNGSYGGDAEIEDLDVPLALSIDFERWAFTVKVPYLSVRTTEAGQATTETGLGDVTATVTMFDVASNRQRGLALDVTGAVKLGTADPDKGLGTGETDFSVYVDGYKFYDSATLLASIGHRWRGSIPEAPLDDVLLATIGATTHTGNGTLLGATLDWRESALADASDIQELTVFASFLLGERWVLECHAFTGFTDSSADWGGGIAVATQLRRFGFRASSY